MASATLSCRSGRGQGEGIHFDPIGSLPHTVLLVLIVLLYLVLALAYARATPAWQAPDEPAHFNYVRELAETGDLPVLEPGAYPASVVPLAPSARPTDISAFQYEAHQPPLFYALAALAYKLNPSLFAVRALSVLFGALLLPVAFWCSRLSVPQCPWLWLAASAFVAFIPMQLFDAGSAENDTLGELITSLLLLVYLALVSGWSSRWRWAMVGGLAGLAVLTKVNIYPPTAALVILALVYSWRKRQLGQALGTIVPAVLVVSGWWLVRNGLTYGWADFLAQQRQAQVAGSQVHTGSFGPAEFGNFVALSFHSFWGQFGWMSLPLPQRDYLVLAAFTLIAAAGWVIVLATRRRDLHVWPWLGLALAWLAVVAGDLYYNRTFVQGQGRYLFFALVPIALFYVYGFGALFPRRAQPAAAACLSVGMLVFSAFTLQHDLIPAFR